MGIRDWPIINRKDIEQVLNSLKNEELSIQNGKDSLIEQYENKFGEFVNRKYVLNVTNGTASLHSAYFAIGIKKDDEVIVPCLTWHSSVTPLLDLGARPVFCDIDETLNIDPDSIEKLISSKTKAVLVCHLYGVAANLDNILKIAKKYDLKIIEDCSHAYGTKFKGKQVGCFGDISCFSTQNSKTLSSGEGGFFCTDNREYYEKALLLGHFGRLNKITISKLKKFKDTGFGFKYRPSLLNVSLGYSQLDKINDLIRLKNQNSIYLEEKFKNQPIKGLDIIKTPDYCDSRSFYGFKIRYDGDKIGLKKELFILRLNKKGVKASNERYGLLHKHEIFRYNPYLDKKLSSVNFDLEKSEKIYDSLIDIQLPSRPNKELIDNIFSSIKEVVSRKVDQITFELTLDCNMDCKECYQKDYRSSIKKRFEGKDLISVKRFEEILDEFNPKKVVLSGGEATIRKDFFDFLDVLKKKNIFFTLLTNGRSFDLDFVQKIKKYGGGGILNFSFDYFNDDNLPKKDYKSSKNIMGLIDTLKKEFIIGIGSVVYEDNLSDLKKIIAYSDKNRFTTMILPNEFYSKEELDITKKRLSKILKKDQKDIEIIAISKNINGSEKIPAQKNLMDIKKNIEDLTEISFLPEHLNISVEDFYEVAPAKGFCKNILTNSLRVDPYGNFKICRIIREDLTKKVCNKNDVLHSKVLNNFINDYLENRAYPICKRCAHFILKQ
ncbi:hypothetical protein C0585_07780 [Candidatus Woesearchaeota archaeon]|nr:MAG: hypothetical protein C0585_07780 [Candidatus Woesearchaeota archaeon]